MTITCPAGHVTSAPDFCDVCGLMIGEIEGAGTAARCREEDRPDAAITSDSRPTGCGVCPSCGGAVLSGDSFCEHCGAVLGDSALEPAQQSAASLAAPREGLREWEAVVTFDASYSWRVEFSEAGPRPEASERTIPLVSDVVTVGRASKSRGEVPDVDLSEAPADPGVSHRHAVLSRRPDGGWSVIDCGSLNGTFLNDRDDPIPTGEPVDLSDGDRLHIGAWTTVVLRAVEAATSSSAGST
jgi:hypothetical protein